MRPKNPEQVTAEKSNGCRLTIPSDRLPAWVDASRPQVLKMVPLAWKRDLALPDGHELEAWLLWGEEETSDEWIVDPKLVLEPAQASPNRVHLATLIHDAALTLSDRKHRLSCSGLFKYLVERCGPKLWLTDEGASFGVMTDFAYHSSYGNLRL